MYWLKLQGIKNNLSLGGKKTWQLNVETIVHSPLEMRKGEKAVWSAWNSKDPHLELTVRDLTISKHM